MSWIKRLLTIALGYVAASLVAGVILGAALVYRPDSAWGPIDLDFAQITALFVAMVSGFVAVLALIPTLIIGVYAELAAVRSPWFYALGGALIGLCALGLYCFVLISRSGNSLSEALPPDTTTIGLVAIVAGIAAVVALAGIAAGVTYWAIAGRWAGGRLSLAG